MSIRVRNATDKDIDGVLPLVKDFVTSFEIDESKFRESFHKILKDENALALVAKDEAYIIGYCLGFSHETFYANGRVAWLEEIMVSTSHRRHGVGESLMGEFENWAQGQGAILSALATRRASSFYEALNYEGSATYYRKLL